MVVVFGGAEDKPDLPAAAGTADRSREGRDVLDRSAKGSAEEQARARVEASYPASVRRRVARMSLRRQVAQIFAAGFAGRTADAPFYKSLRRRGWGAVVLERRNFESES